MGRILSKEAFRLKSKGVTLLKVIHSLMFICFILLLQPPKLFLFTYFVTRPVSSIYYDVVIRFIRATLSQIGRASCREKVYVRGGAVTVKKKK